MNQLSNINELYDMLIDVLDEEYAYKDYSELNDNLELEDDVFGIEVCMESEIGIAFPIHIDHIDDFDVELRTSFNNRNNIPTSVLIDLCNYLMAHYIFLRWYVYEDRLVASYSLTLAEENRESVARILFHLNLFMQVLEEVYPMILRTLWGDSYES